MRRLFIAAKAPRPGLAKTRLAAVLGHDAALSLYRAFLVDLADRFGGGPVPLGWYVTPPDAWADLAPLVERGGAAEIVAQVGDDWTERQRHLFLGAADRGEERTVLIASDSPQITTQEIARAFAALDRHPLVLGPTHDGGYSLIGMRGWHDVLAGVPMSTDGVLEAIVHRAGRMGLSVALLEATFDVDEVGDLGRLADAAAERGDMRATRRALAGLGAERAA